jgi:predicted glycosyltransferase involved in capsule biosynthesis
MKNEKLPSREFFIMEDYMKTSGIYYTGQLDVRIPYKLGIIIPFRYAKEREDAISRAEDLLKTNLPEDVCFILVDSGSPKRKAEVMEELCKKYKAKYIYMDTASEIFSAGKARDVGAMYANCEYLFFQDIDLLPYEGFYEDLLNEIIVQKLDEYNEDFIMVPCAYLTEKGSQEYKETSPHLRKSLFLQYIYQAKSEIILNYAPGSSAILIKRMHYLSIGGHDKDFFGHGFEDFEFVHRAATVSTKYYRPFQYYNDYKKWNTNEYLGFRSMYRLFGDVMASKGIFLAHIWHKPIKKNSTYVGKNKENAKLLIEKMKAFDQTLKHPAPLQDIYRGKTLALGLETNAFYKSIPQIMPSLGEVIFRPEHTFVDEEELFDYITYHHVTRVMFPNPYGNEKRLSLYQFLKEKNFPILVSDRGALNDSVFFDENGFNADSLSYSAEKWDRPLSLEEEQKVEAYIEKEYFSESSLEEQGARIGGEKLSQNLQVKNKKVLFVPFQRPSDTVIKYFSGSVSGVHDFSLFVENVAEMLGDDWMVIAKKHPLEQVRPSKKLHFVADNTHIKDLIEIADAVLLINSGVGVLSMLWYKPVLYVGNAFYGHDEINRKVTSPEEAVETLNNMFTVNRDKAKRFIYYLISDFYSFGKTRYETVTRDDGSQYKVTREINFYQINIPGVKRRNYALRNNPEIPFSSPVFDRYRTYLEMVASKKENQTVANKNQRNVQKKCNNEKKEKPVKSSESTKERPQNIKENSNEVEKPYGSIENWHVRQAAKLISDPGLFMKQYKKWRKKRKMQRS